MTEGGQSPSPGSYAALSRLRRPRTPGAATHPDHTLNDPEQIRTNLNESERRRTLRPDREVARITPEQPEKRNLNTETSSLRSRRSTPHLTSPLSGGRDELGKGGGKGCWGEVGSCLRRNDGWGAQG